MKIKKLEFCENAISSVVSAVLLLGILVSVITVINVQYIPEWKTAAEQSHMDDVFYDMAEMKNEVDILSSYVRTDASTSLSVSIPIKMGGGSLPIFSPGKSGGRLAINEENFSLNIVANTPGLTYNSDSVLLDLGTVSYMSDNNYFVDQKLVYENGALLISQNDYSLMRLAPQIGMKMTENETNITMNINTIDINGPKRSISSNSVEELNLRTNGSDSLYWEGIVFTDMTMIVETSYPSSWVTFFETLAEDAGIDSAGYSITSNETAVVFFLEGNTGEDIKLNVTKTIFDARLNLLI
ncbi:hypothetical protein RE476_01905 [Methanolobus mangrovi]|uniref:Uncharacterized protein n=1 Tax=Methanolobus mangrovi TaxID=3072977 RepID=A0AA51UGM2_9EURY|nr:hypothetical protein [Methanolobus mangrovi]WMW22598.1 hypothetical protein RE476_01905 [Methanolobus mangrovi]